MNNTTKGLALLLMIVVGIGMVSAAPNQDCLNCPNGVAMNMIGCFELNPDVQAAVELATHERYTDEEAVEAMGPTMDNNPLNHDRPAGIGGYEIVPDRVTIENTFFGTLLTHTALCPPGKMALGGGGRLIKTLTGEPADQNNRQVTRSSPTLDKFGVPDGLGWTMAWLDLEFVFDTVDVEVYCICASME